MPTLVHSPPYTKATKVTEDDSLLGYFAVQSRRSLPIFQRCILPTLSLIALMMVAVTASETSVIFNETIWRNNWKDRAMRQVVFLRHPVAEIRVSALVNMWDLW
jgi:2-methylaconitate cis-trans-isomerase PrpF